MYPRPMALATLVAALGISSETALAGNVSAGKQIATDRSRGNCIACHYLPGGQSPGNIGPALVGIQSRYPTKESLMAQIYDATVANPETIMPPFGRHQILSDRELEDVVEYIWSL